MAIKKSCRRAVSAAFGFFLLVATANAQHALPSVTTVGVANAVSIPYDLKAGASTRAISVPANVPVHLIGVQTSTGNAVGIFFQGVGEVTLLRLSSLIDWVGLESPFTGGTATITSGTSGSPGKAGTHIVFLDFFHEVDVELASPGTIKIVNKSRFTAIGTITLIW